MQERVEGNRREERFRALVNPYNDVGDQQWKEVHVCRWGRSSCVLGVWLKDPAQNRGYMGIFHRMGDEKYPLLEMAEQCSSCPMS